MYSTELDKYSGNLLLCFLQHKIYCFCDGTGKGGSGGGGVGGAGVEVKFWIFTGGRGGYPIEDMKTRGDFGHFVIT